MARVTYSREARQDLLSIWYYIADRNPHAADKIYDTVREKSSLPAKFPKMGAARPDLRSDLRYFPVGNYLILSRIISDGVEIVRVLHGARNLQAIFHGDE